MVQLNRAVAVAMRDGPAAGLALVNALLAQARLELRYAARQGGLARVVDEGLFRTRVNMDAIAQIQHLGLLHARLVVPRIKALRAEFWHFVATSEPLADDVRQRLEALIGAAFLDGGFDAAGVGLPTLRRMARGG